MGALTAANKEPHSHPSPSALHPYTRDASRGLAYTWSQAVFVGLCLHYVTDRHVLQLGPRHLCIKVPCTHPTIHPGVRTFVEVSQKHHNAATGHFHRPKKMPDAHLLPIPTASPNRAHNTLSASVYHLSLFSPPCSAGWVTTARPSCPGQNPSSPSEADFVLDLQQRIQSKYPKQRG